MSAWNFEHTERPLRLLVGEDAPDRLADELEALYRERALVISTPGRRELADRLVEALGPKCAGVFDGAEEQVPRETVEAAREAFARTAADSVVTVGGGSPIGLGKALALESMEPLPLVVFPTTYAGSESTAIWGISDGGSKTTGRDERVAPRIVAYVPSWTTTLPADVSAASGINAMAHCVEALYASDSTPMTDMMSVEAIRALGEALPVIVEDLEDLDARSQALWGAFLAGRALDEASLGLHHKLCHVLGGSFGTPHAKTHAVILPYATAYNAPAAPHAMETIARALGADDAVSGLWQLNRRLGIPASLTEIGFVEDDVDDAVEEALAKQYPNPRPLEAAPLRAMLLDATRGERPGDYR